MPPRTRASSGMDRAMESETSKSLELRREVEKLSKESREQEESTAQILCLLEAQSARDNRDTPPAADSTAGAVGPIVPKGHHERHALPALPAVGRLITEFQRLRPPSFNEIEDYKGLFDWVGEMEKDFMSFNYLEEDKLMLGTHHLVGDAHNWLLMEEERMKGQQMTWEQFKERLFATYVPRAKRAALKKEFLHLKQEKMTVMEYDREYCILESVVGQPMASEAERMTKFEDGLRFSIRDFVKSRHAQTYGNSFDAELMVEVNEQQKVEVLGKQKKRIYQSTGRK